MLVGELIIKRSLSSQKGGTKFEDEVMFTGFLKYVFGFILGKNFRKVLPTVLNNFKEMVEKN